MLVILHEPLLGCIITLG